VQFYLGTHETSWLGRLDVPLFISHHRLAMRKRLPVAQAGWALDSGGFTELEQFGRWRTTADEYVEAAQRYTEEIGLLDWAAPMDWMCEPHMLQRTGLSVREHQERTVESYLELRGHGPFIPVLQGWTLADYETCVELYASAGVDLGAERVVGVGSVCRRQSTDEIGQIMHVLHGYGLRLHGFGVKKEGLARYGRYLESADSMAWSYRARRDWPLPGCSHRNCANCSRYALRWRDELLLPTGQLEFSDPDLSFRCGLTSRRWVA
jgi:hypothetical protein